MTKWKNHHIYYTNINQLILSCIEPFVNSQRWPDMRYFWERHYAGGTHLRLRFTASPECLPRFDEAVVHHVQTFLQAQPSVPVSAFSADRCREMLILDGEDVSSDDLRYRVNEIRPVPYQRLNHTLPSSATVAIIEEFLQDVRPLAVCAISHPDAVRIEVIQLYFWTALFRCDDLPRGSVSYKSHWSGFAASFRNRALIDRIRHSYSDHRQQLTEIMHQVLTLNGEASLPSSDFLMQWQSLLEKYSSRVSLETRLGIELTPRMKSVADVRQGRQWILNNTVEESDFLDLLYANDTNLLVLGQDPGTVVPRVLTNLLYLFVSLVGLSFLDKMVLCYYAHRTVEDNFHCNLTDIANETLTRLREKSMITISDTEPQ